LSPWGFFDIPGSKVWIRDSKAVPAPAIRKPQSNVLNEIFKIEDGEIRLIQAFNIADAPCGTSTGRP
jgi:hypothetical protein